MTTLVTTISETLRYRGALGQWSWVLHRLTGLGVVLFLTLHVIDTSWAVFYPAQYERAIASYQSPLFTVGEFGLVFAVVYHALNGLRIAIIDYRPAWWKYQQRAALLVLGGTTLILIPAFILMFGHVVDFYNEVPFVVPFINVILEQLPFAVGITAAAIAAILLSGLYGVVAGNRDNTNRKGRGSRLERFWWSFMRVSGIIIVPLVFGHLAMIHLIQGVFDITAQGAVVGTTFANTSATATEFVANRWGFLLGGVAVWKVYDFALLSLVCVHGFNGLRLVLTDYTMSSPLLRRAAVYFCVIGAVTLLVLGGGALLSTIPASAIDMARESLLNIRGEALEESGIDPALAPVVTQDVNE